jgi:hypothetical protein
VKHPEHGVDGDSLLREADIAVFAVKDARSGYRVYAPADSSPCTEA